MPPVSVVDDDLGLSGAQTAGRSGFALAMATEVAMGRVGIVLCLEVSPGWRTAAMPTGIVCCSTSVPSRER